MTVLFARWRFTTLSLQDLSPIQCPWWYYWDPKFVNFLSINYWQYFASLTPSSSFATLFPASMPWALKVVRIWATCKFQNSQKMHFSCSIFRFFQNGSWNNGCIWTSGNVWICSFDCCVDLWKTFCHQITSSCKSFVRYSIYVLIYFLAFISFYYSIGFTSLQLPGGNISPTTLFLSLFCLWSSIFLCSSTCRYVFTYISHHVVHAIRSKSCFLVRPC